MSKKYGGFTKASVFVEYLIKPITKKRPAHLTLLLKNWKELVGNKYYHYCHPEKVRNSKNQTTLEIVAYNPAMAVLIEASALQIIEKIAIFFGYKMIDKITIKQEPRMVVLQEEEEVKKISAQQQKSLENMLGDVEDEGLKASLSKLGAQIYAKGDEVE